MGYTHYWNTSRDFTDEEWANIRFNVAPLLERGYPRIIQRENDNDDPPTNSTSEIWFNGIGGNSHETFSLRKSRHSDFCKTDRKPYDRYVACVLLIVQNLYPDVLTFTSDGWVEDMEPHVKWMQVQFNILLTIPDTIEAG